MKREPFVIEKEKNIMDIRPQPPQGILANDCILIIQMKFGIKINKTVIFRTVIRSLDYLDDVF